MSGNTLRRHLSMPGLLSPVRRAFDAVPDPVDPRGLSLSGCLMSGLAVFSLKMPSLLQFDSRVRLGEDPALRRNVRALFGVGRVPSDTAMRERLDRIGPRELRGAFRAVHASLQRGKALRSFTAPGGHLLLSMDGTEYFSSAKTGCARRCRRRQGDGFANCRRMPGAAFAHPDRSQVFPAAPGMIRNEDGASKNDCGRNAAARLLADFPARASASEDNCHRGRAFLGRPRRQAAEIKGSPVHPRGEAGRPQVHVRLAGEPGGDKLAGSPDAVPDGRDRPQLPLGGGHAAERDALRSGREPRAPR